MTQPNKLYEIFIVRSLTIIINMIPVSIDSIKNLKTNKIKNIIEDYGEINYMQMQYTHIINEKTIHNVFKISTCKKKE